MSRASPAKPAEIQRAVDLRAAGLQYNEIADILKRKPKTITSWLQKGGQAERLGLEPGQIKDEFETIRASMEERVRDLESQLASIVRDNVSARRIRETVTGLQANLPEPPDWILRESKKGSPGTPVTLWSDWHIGEVVSREQTGGVNEFNMDIAQKRVRLLVEKIVDLCFNHQTNPDYPGIVVCLGGDMISGLIHQELVETMEGPFASQFFETYALLKWALRTLADRFGRVFVVCVVGNHGRMWSKPRAKNRVFDSYEFMLYCFLEATFNPTDQEGKRLPDYDDRFRFFVPEQTDAYFTVAGHRFLLTHGDSTGAKGGDGIIGAVGPIIRGEKKVREVATFSEDYYDTAMMGHYHQFVSMDSVIVNPTLKGYDEYARNVLRARPEVPAQVLLFVHSDYGIIDQRRVFLEKKLQIDRKSEWVTWRKAA